MDASEHSMTPEEAAFYEGGHISRRSHGSYEITSIKVIEEFRRLIVQYAMPSGSIVIRSIPLRFVKLVRIDDGSGRMRIEGKRYGNSPLFLEPHPDKKQQAAELFAEPAHERSA